MKKKTTERKTTRHRKAPPRTATKTIVNPGRRYELTGLVFVAIGLISLCGLFGLNVGFVGVYFAKCLHYLFGIGAVVISLLILLIGYQYMAKHHGLVYSLRFFGMGLLFLSLLAIWHHFVIPTGEEIMPDSLPRGGGLMGGGLLFCLRKFFGIDGSIILLGIGTIGAILLSTTWSLAAGLLKTQKTAAKGANAAGEVVSVAYEKVADVSGRVEECVVDAVKEKVKNSFYNQERDERFRGQEKSAASQILTEKDAGVVATTESSVLEDEPWRCQRLEDAEPKQPKFTIEYGRDHVEESENDSDFSSGNHPVIPHTDPVTAPSPNLMKKNPVTMP